MKTFFVQVIYKTGDFEDIYVDARTAKEAHRKVSRLARVKADRWVRVII